MKIFFSKLKEVYERCQSFADGTRVFNLDESSTSTVQSPKNVIAQRGTKQVSQTTSFERGTLVTTCCIINALGSFLPPIMVFSRAHFKDHMIKDAPTGTIGLAMPSGWMTSKLFLEVMKHFIKHSSASNKNPSLLILDNHESHLSISVLDLVKSNGVAILTIYPHSSHKLQPLGKSVYGPFKAYYSSEMTSRLSQKPGIPLTIYNIALLVNKAFRRALTSTNIISGFKCTGIFPFDENIFQESDFAEKLGN